MTALKQNFLVSVVLDWVPDHPYKAQALLKTLQAFGVVGPERVLLHYVNRVSKETVETFRSMGCHCIAIEPYLDGTICNKLRQYRVPEHPAAASASGLLLLDLDMVVAAPLCIPNHQQVCGKIVDNSNPPFEVLESVFKHFNVKEERLIESDWSTGPTYATNLNGGCIYIPMSLLTTLGKTTCNFAEQLFEVRGKFPQQSFYIDQIAFSLALSKLKLPISYLTANSNFPTHHSLTPRTYEPSSPIRLVHYHNNLDDFGFVSPALKHGGIENALESVNPLLETSTNIEFYRLFKEQRANKRCQNLPGLHPQHDFVVRLQQLNNRRKGLPKVIFHVGTLKTGTTSLQHLFNERREQFACQGVYYPSTRGAAEPKHQFLIEALLLNDTKSFASQLLELIEESPANTQSLIISTEGFSNHWWDFSSDCLAILKHLSACTDVEYLLVIRNHEEFAVSLYRQYLKNPPVHPCYGTALSFEDMIGVPWFVKHLDYTGFILELLALGSNTQVTVCSYSSQVVEALCKHLKLCSLPSSIARKNESISRLEVFFTRQLNRYTHGGRKRVLLSKVIALCFRWTKRIESPQKPLDKAIQRLRVLTQKDKGLLAHWRQQPPDNLGFLD